MTYGRINSILRNNLVVECCYRLYTEDSKTQRLRTRRLGKYRLGLKTIETSPWFPSRRETPKKTTEVSQDTRALFPCPSNPSELVSSSNYPLPDDRPSPSTYTFQLFLLSKWRKSVPLESQPFI